MQVLGIVHLAISSDCASTLCMCMSLTKTSKLVEFVAQWDVAVSVYVHCISLCMAIRPPGNTAAHCPCITIGDGVPHPSHASDGWGLITLKLSIVCVVYGCLGSCNAFWAQAVLCRMLHLHCAILCAFLSGMDGSITEVLSLLLSPISVLSQHN